MTPDRTPQQVVHRLLEAEQPPDWPEFDGWTQAEFEDYLNDLPIIYLTDTQGETHSFYMDDHNCFLFPVRPGKQPMRFFGRTELEDFLEDNEPKEVIDRDRHIFNAPEREKPLAPIPLEQKLQYEVFRHGHFVVLKMPHDEEFIRAEGAAMFHCLNWAFRDYCARMRSGEIDLYSLTDLRDGLPKVDIEVALKRSSYGGPVGAPTVTQLRGMRNECPPKDEYLEPLIAFFKAYGKDWNLSGHGVRSFDLRTDGDEFIRRWKELHGES